MSHQNQTKILHYKRNKECSFLTTYNAVQGTGCNLAWAETHTHTIHKHRQRMKTPVCHNYTLWMDTYCSALLNLFSCKILSKLFENMRSSLMYWKASKHQTVQLTAGLWCNVPINTHHYVIFTICPCTLIVVSMYSYCYLCILIVVYVFLDRVLWLRFFRAFSSVVRQMPG